MTSQLPLSTKDIKTPDEYEDSVRERRAAEKRRRRQRRIDLLWQLNPLTWPFRLIYYIGTRWGGMTCIIILALCGNAGADPDTMLGIHRGDVHAEFWINRGDYTESGGPTHCCGPGDCKPYPMEQTRVNPNGDITLLNHDGSFYMTVAAGDVQASEDHQAWFCKRGFPIEAQPAMRCFFYPVGGF